MQTIEDAVEQTTVNDTIRRFPESVAVFKELGIDTCCGGAATLAEAAARKDIPLPELLKALQAATRCA
jgi:regulator of cell morphogenesis and NO signaling